MVLTQYVMSLVGARKRKREAAFAAPPCCAALLEWAKAEILEDEGAEIIARNNAEWERLGYLGGHKTALVQVVQFLTAQHNAELRHGEKNQ